MLSKKTQEDGATVAAKLGKAEKGKLSKQSVLEKRILVNLIVGVCVLVIVVHLPALSARALSFDDSQYLSNNTLVQRPSLNSAWRFVCEVFKPSTVRGYYQPLSMISLMIDYAWGGRPHYLQPFHRTSLALHVTNTALVIILLYQLFGQSWIAAGAGLLFGLHPMTVETIAWASERKTLLAAFFSLWSLILYIRFARKGDWRFYTCCLVMYVLALMSKPTAIPLPALLLLLDYWPLGRLKRRSIVEKIPFLAMGALFAVITYISQRNTATIGLPSEYGFRYVPPIVCHNVIFYLCKVLWPANLSSHYPYPEPFGLSNPAILAGIIGTCILIPLLLVSLRWTRAAMTGWLFLLIAILPTMQIVRFSNVIAADKFLYLSSVGLLMTLAFFLACVCRKGALGPNTVRYVAAVVLLSAGAEAVGTRRYLRHWRDSLSLAQHMVKLAPNVAMLQDMLGSAYLDRKEMDLAETHYLRALELNPRYVPAWTDLGHMYALESREDRAIRCFQRSLELDPNNSLAHNNLGASFYKIGELDKAEIYYRHALRLAPEMHLCHRNLGKLLLEKGRLREGLDHLWYAVYLRPEFALALTDIAWVLATHPEARVRNPAKAVRLAERASQLTKHQVMRVADVLAAAYAAAGQFGRAVTTAEQAPTLLNPDGDAGLPRQIDERLQLYRQGKPYLEDPTERRTYSTPAVSEDGEVENG
ncbi:MAG: tetratricopeptide repeat protein [Planctomycetota bacterium]|jgi:tetratricopeptide (TPR) repeat protein